MLLAAALVWSSSVLANDPGAAPPAPVPLVDFASHDSGTRPGDDKVILEEDLRAFYGECLRSNRLVSRRLTTLRCREARSEQGGTAQTIFGHLPTTGAC